MPDFEYEGPSAEQIAQRQQALQKAGPSKPPKKKKEKKKKKPQGQQAQPTTPSGDWLDTLGNVFKWGANNLVGGAEYIHRNVTTPVYNAISQYIWPTTTAQHGPMPGGKPGIQPSEQQMIQGDYTYDGPPPETSHVGPPAKPTPPKAPPAQAPIQQKTPYTTPQAYEHGYDPKAEQRAVYPKHGPAHYGVRPDYSYGGMYRTATLGPYLSPAQEASDWRDRRARGIESYNKRQELIKKGMFIINRPKG